MSNGRTTLVGFIVFMLSMGLIITTVTLSINGLSSNYDIEGFDVTDMSSFDQFDNITKIINQSSQDVEQVTVDRGAFDFLSDIFNKVLSPFKFIYRSYTLTISSIIGLVGIFHFYSVITDYLIALLILVVVIGIVMLRILMRRES